MNRQNSQGIRLLMREFRGKGGMGEGAEGWEWAEGGNAGMMERQKEKQNVRQDGERERTGGANHYQVLTRQPRVRT
jgi:hypothetical protein